MTKAISHRGPDDAGAFFEEASGLAMGTRRLAVIDLSPQGHQPMASADGRFVLTYNGEIYNFAELRRTLQGEGLAFRGSSDTEVLVGGIQRWGLTETLTRCNGMFALAVWDRHQQRLSLARDRFGEKPLYYGWMGGVFLFGSELKALRAHDAFQGEVDRGVLALYFRHNCVPSPYCIYRGIAQLQPGTTVTVAKATPPGHMPHPEPFWALRDVAEAGVASRSQVQLGATEALDDLDAVLGQAVRVRMHADVPLGAFLSGGIDSSLVVALMQAHATAKVKTFTIAFDDAELDEATDARRVAEHLGTDHVELKVTDREALDVIPRLPTLYDEPFSDSSQIPTAVLATLARRHVTVALSGDGGDELFGGYNRYVWAERFWSRLEPVPVPLRRLTGAGLQAVPPRWWDRAFRLAGPLVPPPVRTRMPGIKVHKAARVLSAVDLYETYRLLASHNDNPGALVLGSDEQTTLLSDRGRWPDVAEPVDVMMYLDAMTYLPDDILTKVDRATMGASLEGRLPFLDHNVADLAWRLPPAMKVRGGAGKWLLRRLLYRYVPAELVERPKAGFGVPLGAWLRGPLRPWAEDLLDESRIHNQGYLAFRPVRRLWAEHLSGRHDRQYELWDVLMFQAWMDSQ